MNWKYGKNEWKEKKKNDELVGKGKKKWWNMPGMLEWIIKWTEEKKKV